ncbi:uncharacterized protein LOC132789291 isoform X2 [Drosophila nasuta]|uniref:uncharacterized protein LOC132789291 isoform X2 n=1 Tax=Drosophila nasuta TaxID=42062 RepID=UPI00295E4D3C|nr:uncharacterized protein LOC132789291 isoform X2 [Drosophila nasuta]
MRGMGHGACSTDMHEKGGKEHFRQAPPEISLHTYVVAKEQSEGGGHQIETESYAIIANKRFRAVSNAYSKRRKSQLSAMTSNNW